MSRRPLSFADAPALLIFLAILAYIIAGAAQAAGHRLQLYEAAEASIELEGESLSGIAIAPEALRQEGEDCYVWVLTAGRAEKKTVNIIHASAGLILAEAERRESALRPGDKLIVSGEGIYEGKILI